MVDLDRWSRINPRKKTHCSSKIITSLGFEERSGMLAVKIANDTDGYIVSSSACTAHDQRNRDGEHQFGSVWESFLDLVLKCALISRRGF